VISVIKIDCLISLQEKQSIYLDIN